MNGIASERPVTSRRAMLAKAATGLAVGGGALAVTAAGRSQAVAATTGIPWLVEPSADQTGVQDVQNVQGALTSYGVAWLAPGTYYSASSVKGHEGQYVHGTGQQDVFWQMTGGNFPAFEWTPANSSSYSILGKGGLTGITILGPSTTRNPTDGSIGVQMGDIVHLECDVFIRNCQYGLLLSNQYYWTERGNFRVTSQYCTNPVVLQCAQTGGSQRTGSFERCDILVYHNETLPGFGNGGVQLLAGAFITGGSIRQSGNWGGSGQSGVYALYVSGEAPAGAGQINYSNVVAAELAHALEYNGTGTPPSSIYIGTNSYALDNRGVLNYPYGWGTAPSVNGPWSYWGPITNDYVLLQKLWGYIGSGFPSGWTGHIRYRPAGNGDQAAIDWAFAIASGTVINTGETIATMPSGYYYPSDAKILSGSLNGGGLAGYQFAPLRLNGSGSVVYGGPSFTASGSAWWYGDATYPVQV
jgi:hypothetical protein